VSTPNPNADVVLHGLPDGEHALVDAERGRMLLVNDVGAAVWLMLDGRRPLAEIIATIVAARNSPSERVSTDVQAFMEELRAHGFVS